MRMALKTGNKRLYGLLFVLAGVGSGAVAQYVLLLSTKKALAYWDWHDWWAKSLQNNFPLPGMLLYLLAGGLFVVGLRLLGERLPAPKIDLRNIPFPKTRAWLWFFSLAVAVAIAIHNAFAPRSDPYGYFTLVAWWIAILLPLFSLLFASCRLAPLRDWFKAHRAELFVVATLLLAAFLIRFVDVELQPYSFINDEGHMGSGGECILAGQCSNFFFLDWAAQPLLAYIPYAFGILFFGRTAVAVRLVSVLTGTFSVLAVYLLAREWFGRKVAWLAAILLCTLPIHVHFSRTGVDNIVDALTAPLILWLLFRGVRRGSRLCFLAAGVVSGLCMYIYPGSLLAAALGIVALAYLALRTPSFLKAHLHNLVVFVLAAAIVVIPILGFYSTHNQLFLARLKTENILQNGRLEYAAQQDGLDPAAVLVEQFEKSSLVYIASDAPLNFFNSPQAYLPPLEALLFMLGFAYVLWRLRDPRCFVIFVWFWSVVILGSALTGALPANQRILMSLSAVVLLVSIGLTRTLEPFERLWPVFAKIMPLVLVGLVLFIGYTNLRFYFYDYRIGHYYEEIQNELPYEARVYVTPLHNQGRLFVIGDPQVPYLLSQSFEYFAPDVEKHSLSDVSLEFLLSIRPDRDALFLALPDYKAELDKLAFWIPGGEWHEVHRRYQPQYVLFYVYKLSKERMLNFNLMSGGFENSLH